jgi:hypothetical protein
LSCSKKLEKNDKSIEAKDLNLLRCVNHSDSLLNYFCNENFLNGIQKVERPKAILYEFILNFCRNTNVEIKNIKYFDYFKELNTERLGYDIYDVVYIADLKEEYDDAYVIFQFRINNEGIVWRNLEIHNTTKNLDLIQLIKERNSLVNNPK